MQRFAFVIPSRSRKRLGCDMDELLKLKYDVQVKSSLCYLTTKLNFAQAVHPLGVFAVNPLCDSLTTLNYPRPT